MKWAVTAFMAICLGDWYQRDPRAASIPMAFMAGLGLLFVYEAVEGAVRWRGSAQRTLGLKPCPNCGRYPRLTYTLVRCDYAAGRCALWYSCRHWMGLRVCLAPHSANWVAKDDIRMGIEVAAERWNRAVHAELGSGAAIQ